MTSTNASKARKRKRRTSGIHEARGSIARVQFPPPRRRMDWDEALRLYREEGWTFARIAHEFDYSPTTVRATLRRMGAARRRAAPWSQSATGRKLYGQWIEMRQRCENPGHPLFRNYGARGVTICADWASFDAFSRWARANGYRGGRGLYLIEGRRSFSPADCRWISSQERHRLRVRRFPPSHTRFLAAFGEVKSLTAWAKDARCRVGRSMIVHRLERGLTAERAISEPHGSPVVIAHMASKRKRRGQSRTHVSRATLERMHHVDGLSCAEITRRLGMSYSGVYDRLQRLGLFRSTRTSAKKTPEDRRLYRTWLTIKMSAENPRFVGWRTVGARGIGVDRRWASSEPFIAWARRTGAAPGLCLVRIDPTKDYGPDNCEWVIRAEASARARHHVGERRPRIVVTAFGETKGVTAWSRDPRCNVTLSGLLRRLRAGWHPALAITKAPATPGGGSRSLITAFGMEKSLGEWLRDRRCKLLSADALRDRIERGMSPEDAIRTPPYAERALRLRDGARVAARR